MGRKEFLGTWPQWVLGPDLSSGTSFIPIGEGQVRLKKAVQSWYECLIFWPLIIRLFSSEMWNVCRALPYKYTCIIQDAVNRIARALWGVKHSINKHFYAYSSQTKALRVLQIYEHPQTINVYNHKREVIKIGERRPAENGSSSLHCTL